MKKTTSIIISILLLFSFFNSINAQETQCVSFNDSFTETSIDNSKWVTSTENLDTIETSSQGLTILHSATAVNNATLATKYSFKNDFVSSIKIINLTGAMDPTKASSAYFTLRAGNSLDPQNPIIRSGIIKTQDGINIYTWDSRENKNILGRKITQGEEITLTIIKNTANNSLTIYDGNNLLRTISDLPDIAYHLRLVAGVAPLSDNSNSSPQNVVATFKDFKLNCNSKEFTAVNTINNTASPLPNIPTYTQTNTSTILYVVLAISFITNIVLAVMLLLQNKKKEIIPPTTSTLPR